MRRILLSILVLFAVCAGFSGAANATTCSVAGGGGAGPGDDCYWVGATNSNWTTNTNWSNTPGGASCTCTPVAGANIHLTNGNALSFLGDRTIGDFDAAAYTGTLTVGSVNITTNKVGAAIVFGTGMTVTNGAAGGLTFGAGSGTATLDGGGVTGPLPAIAINAGETVQLTGHNYIAAPAATLSIIFANTAFDANSLNLTIGHVSMGNNANANKTLTCGTGTITVTAVDGIAAWDTRGTVTVSCASGTVVFNMLTKTNTVFVKAETYNNWILNNTGSAMSMGISGTSPLALNDLTIGPYTNFSGFFLNITVANAIVGNGTAAKPIVLDLGANAPKTFTTGTGFTCTYCVLSGITKAGAGAWSITNSFDGGFNTGFTVTPPSGGSSLIGL